MPSLLVYRCPNCGGELKFSSDSQKMKCENCFSEIDVKTFEEQINNPQDVESNSLDLEMLAHRKWEGDEANGMRIYSCTSCGGEIICDETTGASKCPYCNSDVVMLDKFSGVLRPDLLIPFKLDKKTAQKKFSRHTMGKFLLPKSFWKEIDVKEIKGIYVPFWLFDADATADIRFNCTKDIQRRAGDYIIKDTSYYNVSRNGKISFNHIPVDASKKMPDDLMDSLEPFDAKDFKKFAPSYLAGYCAEIYDVSAKENADRVNARIRKTTTNKVKNTVHGYTQVMVSSGKINVSPSKIRYALYPVWILTAEWKGKRYIYAMNGQTGKFVGDLPTDKEYTRKMYLKVFAVAFIALYILQYIIWNIG